MKTKTIRNIKFNEKDKYFTHCLKCGKEIELRYHNGELDYDKCCGLEYTLEYNRIDLVIKEIK